MFRTSRLLVLPVVLLASIVAAGCGSEGKDIADVTACLKEAKLVVEPIDPQKDKDVESGVFATTDFSKLDDPDFRFAMAAHVTSEAAIERFQKKSSEFAKEAGDDIDFTTGVDGRYAWVAGGAKGNDDIPTIRECVKP